MANTVELEIIAEVKKATRTIEQFAKQSEKQLGGIKFGIDVTAINQGIQLVTRALAPFVDLLKFSVQEALESERALASLGQAMRNVGDFSADAVADFERFAGALQDITGIQDETIIGGAALAKSFNVTNNEAKLLVKAAIDLSAATGRDLNSSIEALGKSLNGVADKSLTKIIPGLKSLTTEQLVAGEAIKLVGERFEGSAKAASETFGGALKQLTVQVGETAEIFGSLVVKSEGIRDSILSVVNSLKEYNNVLKDSENRAAAFKVAQTQGIVAGLLSVIGIAREAKKELDNLAETPQNRSSRVAQGGALTGAVNNNAEITKQAERAAAATFEARKQVAKDLANLELELAKSGATERQRILIDFEQKALKIRESTEKGSVKQRIQGEELIAKARIDLEKQIAVARQKEIEEISKNPFTLFTNGKAQKPLIDLTEFEQNLVAAGAAFSASVLKGRQGAEDLVAAGVGVAVGAAFGPAFAGPAAELTKILAQGPEAVKAMLNQFVEALPQIQLSLITALLEVIPEFLTTGITKLIDGFVANISPIIEAVIAAIPKIVVALQTQMPRVAFTLASALIRELPNIVQSFATEFLKIPEQFAKELLANIPGAGSVASGAGSVLGGIGDIFGFADGGKVPDMPQFSNDRFPARLTAGERVLDDGLNRKLEAALDGGGGLGGSGQLVVNFVVGQQTLATMVRDLRLGDFRT